MLQDYEKKGRKREEVNRAPDDLARTFMVVVDVSGGRAAEP